MVTFDEEDELVCTSHQAHRLTSRATNTILNHTFMNHIRGRTNTTLNHIYERNEGEQILF